MELKELTDKKLGLFGYTKRRKVQYSITITTKYT